MPVKISYFLNSSHQTGSLRRLFPGVCVKSETISSFPASGTYVATEETMAILVSSESVPMMAAHGSAPDATLTTATALSGAGYGIPPSQQIAIIMQAGDKINLAAFA